MKNEINSIRESCRSPNLDNTSAWEDTVAGIDMGWRQTAGFFFFSSPGPKALGALNRIGRLRQPSYVQTFKRFYL